VPYAYCPLLDISVRQGIVQLNQDLTSRRQLVFTLGVATVVGIHVHFWAFPQFGLQKKIRTGKVAIVHDLKSTENLATISNTSPQSGFFLERPKNV